MHIAIDIRLTYYRRGGIPNYMEQLARELPSLDPGTHYTILYSRKHKGALRAPPDAPNQHRVPVWTPCHHRFEAAALGLELLRFRLDLLHSPDFIPPFWGARRYVINVHDLNFLYYPQFLTTESRRYYNGQIERAVRQAHHILASSYATKVDLVQMLNVPEEKITVHMLGVEPVFSPQPAETVAAVCEQHDLSAGYILFVGTFEPRKNLPGLVRAYRLLLDELPDLPALVFAGQRGWLYGEVFELVEQLALGEQVRWIENPPFEILPALYSGASVLAMPSFYEGFGLPALEAMACGTPTVVADRASLPEVVGGAGILVDPDDPASIAGGLRRVLTDSALHDRLTRDGLARASTFVWQRTAETVIDVYRAVLST